MEPVEIVSELLFPRLVADRSHAIYQKDLGRHMHAQDPRPDSPALSPIFVPMMEDIALHFVVDNAEGFDTLRAIDRESAPAWDDMALISKAFHNLRDQHGDHVTLQELQAGAYRISSPSRHDASFLLLGNLWMTMEAQLGENMYAAVPSHDVLLVAPQSDRFAVLTLQGLVREIFFEAPAPSLLSKAIYQRWDREWKIVATAF